MRGKRVALLESRFGQQMVDLVVKRGGVPIHAPGLAEIPDVDPKLVGRLVEELGSNPARIAIFQTGVGTRALFDTTDALGLTEKLLALLSKVLVVVRGPKPTAVLRSRKVRIDLSARDPFTTHEVLETLQSTPLEGVRVIVQLYGAANIELASALKARGAEIIDIPTYRWSLPSDTGPLIALIDALERREVDAVAFTNAAQVHNLFTVAAQRGRDEVLRAGLAATLIASIGPVTSAALGEFAIRPSIEASPPKLGPLIAALDQALSP
jgi:uroporphyrinogen-III synthase